MRESLKEIEKLVLGVGSACTKNEENPLSYEEREEMLEIVLEKEGWQEKVVKITDLVDFHDDDKWRKNVFKKAGDFQVAAGNNEWVNKILEEAGRAILRFGFYKRWRYEGEIIRKMIKEGEKEWQERVPGYLVDFLEKRL